jgi:stress-induced morphogen
MGNAMELKDKIAEALREFLHPARTVLEDDDGIIGCVVSAQFQNISPLERQDLIDKALRRSSVKLTKADRRQVLAIVPFTPVEYAAFGWDKKPTNHAVGNAHAGDQKRRVGKKRPGSAKRSTTSRRTVSLPVDFKERVAAALRENLHPEHISLSEGHDGIYGRLVTTQFQRVPAIERQRLIDKALRCSSVKFTEAELRQVRFIAAFTPAELAFHESFD